MQIQNGEYEDENDYNFIESEGSETEDLEETDIVEDDVFEAFTAQNPVDVDLFDVSLPSTSRSAPERRRVVYSKNRHKWYLNSFHAKNTRTSKKNLVLHLPGPKSAVRKLTDVRKIWNSFCTDEILDVIVKYTNQEIQSKKLCYNTEQRYIGETNKV
ncbi:hypothetical protein RN001_008649 [Aquatica leii]|uniref:PiggyBac transposable element-derived protein domain-containing protein n=1 Tax=Aquatica leii TaxID=1421715 RepID=A0AAN7QJ53_9COLE|nr:hypothetical protein RN001_008649 [Aquatica leii]